MTEHYGALEADFQRDYGLHLGEEIWVNNISARRMMSLVTGLPQGSAFHRVSQPKQWNWGHQEELLAVLCELVDRHDRHYIAAHTKDGKVPGDGLEIPRPYETRKPRGTTLSEFIGMTAGAAEVVVDAD